MDRRARSHEFAPGSNRLARGRDLLETEVTAERRDEAWVPPPAPYGHSEGRARSWYVVAGMTVDKHHPTMPSRDAITGTGLIGGELAWDRDRWGGRFTWAPAVSLGVGNRRTSGDSAYFTGALAAELLLVRARPPGYRADAG